MTKQGKRRIYSFDDLIAALDAPRCEVCMHSVAWQDDGFRCNLTRDIVDGDYSCGEFICDLKKANLSNHKLVLAHKLTLQERSKVDGR